MALPKIVRHPKSTVVAIYDDATFKCTARGYGNISIIWRRQNSELPVTATVTNTKSINNTRSILRIQKSIGYYKGNYYCVIANSVGMIGSGFAYLSITGKHFIMVYYSL